MGRQIELTQGSDTLALNDATYILQADGGYQSGPNGVLLKTLVKPTTLAELDRLVNAVRQMLSAATVYEERAAGDAVYVRMKTCDALSTTAEVGATWIRRRVTGGAVTVQPLTGTAAVPQAYLVIRIDTTPDPWQRIVPAPVLEDVSGSTYVTNYGGGAIQFTNSVTLKARRLVWTSTTGITVRTFWRADTSANVQINWLRLSAGFRAYTNPSSGACVLSDETGIVASTNATLVNGTLYEVVVRMSGEDNGIWLNGTRITTWKGALSWPSNPDTYSLIEASGAAGTQIVYSVQLWPVALTDAQITGLPAWGRPVSELCYLYPPSDTKATNAIYKLYNAGGDAPGPVRLMFDSSGATDYGKIRLGYRPRRVPTLIRMECEDGTLGSNTASNANASASAGSQARFTPADTAWATRVTTTLVNAPSALAASQGEYRLFMAGYDSAASVQVNRVKWRMVVAGKAGDWSDELSFANVSERALLDLGTLSLPPGNWPQEAVDATSTAYGFAYVTIELQAANSTGSGGGTLDMDALYVVPAEAEGTVEATFDVSAADLLLDFATEPFAALLVGDPQTFEFAGWATYLGDVFELAPTDGTCGMFFFFWYRDGVEEFFPNDTCDVWFCYAPRYLG